MAVVPIYAKIMQLINCDCANGDVAEKLEKLIEELKVSAGIDVELVWENVPGTTVDGIRMEKYDTNGVTIETRNINKIGKIKGTDWYVFGMTENTSPVISVNDRYIDLIEYAGETRLHFVGFSLDEVQSLNPFLLQLIIDGKLMSFEPSQDDPLTYVATVEKDSLNQPSATMMSGKIYKNGVTKYIPNTIFMPISSDGNRAVYRADRIRVTTIS